MTAHRRRHEPCALLHDCGIPCLVWFEDAVGHYGVPTVVFDLFLLVADIDEAACALHNQGYIFTHEHVKYHLLTQHPSIPHRSLKPRGIRKYDPAKDPPGPTTTILLRAVDWNVAVEDLRPSSPGGFFPPLAILVDALIESLLESPQDCLLRRHLAVHVCYIYGHCEQLKRLNFATHLKPENREFRKDAITKPGLATIPFLAHARQARDEIRSQLRGKKQAESV